MKSSGNKGSQVTSQTPPVIVSIIAATTTRAGLTVRAELDPGSYPDGIKVNRPLGDDVDQLGRPGRPSR